MISMAIDTGFRASFSWIALAGGIGIGTIGVWQLIRLLKNKRLMKDSHKQIPDHLEEKFHALEKSMMPSANEDSELDLVAETSSS